MAYVFSIHHSNTHTIYDQNTLYLIGQYDVTMVTDSQFEYACGDLTCRLSRPGSSRTESLIDELVLPPGSSHVWPGSTLPF